jgi:MoxR-vWA-beta-propeller ternary system domain bpX2
MDSPLADICCACLPATALCQLASLRAHAGIRARVVGEWVWLWWTAGESFVLQRILALQGAEVFARRDGLWYRPGQHVPAFEVPVEKEARPFAHLLTPAPVQAERGGPSLGPLTVGLVRDGRPRAATALCCLLSDLTPWAEQVTSKQLAALEAIYASDCVLLRGSRLPALAVGKRYWGREILIPLGFRVRPELSEGVLREALRLQTHEIALLSDGAFEAIDTLLFQPLTRASVRLAVRERI